MDRLVNGMLWILLQCCVLIVLSMPSHSCIAAREAAITLEDTKRMQDPFEFSRQLDYRQFELLEFGDADLEDVSVYQVRYTHPVAKTGVLPEQFIRVTSAVLRIPTDFTLNASNELSNDDAATGLGDTNIFDAFTLGIGKNYKWGVGPSITIPTNQNSNDKRFGNDNWLAGVAGIGKMRFSGRDQGLIIFNWQKDVQGNDEPVEKLNFQPAYTHSFDQGWFFVSSGIWQFDLENGTHYIPVAAGFGKVFRFRRHLMHAFIEPQWVVDSDDRDKDGNFVPQPDYLVRLGLTLMFAR